MAHYQNQRQTWWGTAQHLISWTRATIVWLRNSWLLIPWVSYEITDHVQWRLVSWTTVTLLATSANDLSHDARVNTTYDNTSWFWLYDIDTWIVYELRDPRNNVARWINGTEVANFDWGNVAYTNVRVDSASLIVNYWNAALINNVTIEKLATVNLTNFAWQINNATFSIVSNSNFTWANGIWRYFEVKDSWSFNLSWYTWWGDNYYNTITSSSSINFSNTTSLIVFRNNTVQWTVISNNWVSTWVFTMNNAVLESGNITHSNWALNFTSSQLNLWQAASISHSRWTLSITRWDIEQSWSVNINTNVATTNLNDIVIRWSSQIINSSLTNMTVTRSIVEWASNIVWANWSAWTMTVTDTRVFGSGSIQKLAWSTAGTMNINQWTVVASSWFIYHNGTWNLTVSQASIDSASRIYVTSWNRNYSLTRVNWREVAQIILNWTGAWITDTIFDTNVDSRWQINFSATWATTNNLQYSKVSWLSWSINVSWTSSGQTIQRSQAIDWSININNCTVAMVHDFLVNSWSWSITIKNLAVAKPVSYATTMTGWNINITGTVAWSVTRLTASTNATINVTWVTWTVNSVDVSEWIVTINGWTTHTNITKRMNSTLTTGNFTTNNIIHISNVNKTMTANNTWRADYLWVVSSVPII